MKVIELKEQRSQLKEQLDMIIDVAKTEVRSLNEEENAQVEDIRAKVIDLNAQIEALEKEEQREAEEVKKEEKRSNIFDNNKKTMKKQNLVKEIREAIDNRQESIKLNAETRAVTVQGENGVHDEVVETEIEGILEPLYANSVLNQLGVRTYTGLPMGDIQIPLMSKNTVKWEGETDEADATGNTFTAIKLSPKRLSAYIDISKQLLYQDTIGVENAIRRDLVRALQDKIEATLFGNEAGTTEQPAGLFYGKTPVQVANFADVCDFEATVENDNVFGSMQYVMNPKAKAKFRSMIKGTNNSGFVYEAGEMDGTPTHVTTNVAENKFVYGDFTNVVVGIWNDLDLTIDTITQATKGCVRLVINAYVDFKAARNVGLAFGTTQA
jgi:HK97 family phage major capsid protein